MFMASAIGTTLGPIPLNWAYKLETRWVTDIETEKQRDRKVKRQGDKESTVLDSPSFSTV